MEYAFNSQLNTLTCENLQQFTLEPSPFGVLTHRQDFLRTLLCRRVL